MKFIIIATIIILVCVILVANSFSMPEPAYYESYVVKSGDSLWEIAQQSDGWNKYDGQMIIEDMRERSNCTATIYPGQVVYVPMYNN